MGLKLAVFGLAFNALYWLSRSTLGLALARQAGWGLGMFVALIGPTALLILAARLLPHRRGALIGVAAASLAASALFAG